MQLKNEKTRNLSIQNITRSQTNENESIGSQKNRSYNHHRNYQESVPSLKTTLSEKTNKSTNVSNFIKFDHKSSKSIDFQALYPELQIIILNECRLKELPRDICTLSCLKQISLDSNYLTKIPDFLPENMALESFSIKNNLLEALPNKFDKWNGSLHRFDFSFNRIDHLSNNLSDLKQLKQLMMNNNNFIKLPTSLFTMKSLEDLGLDWFKYTFPPNPFLISGEMLKIFLKFCEFSFTQGKSYISFKELIDFFSNKKTQLERILPKKRNLIHQSAFENDVGPLRSLITLIPQYVNQIDSESYTPLFLSILEENYIATRILLFSGADPKIGLGMLGGCLHLAVVKKEVFLLQELLKKGGDPNAIDQQGNTPLILLFSTFSNNLQKADKMANILMEFNANPNIKNKEMWNCLHLAVKGQQIEAIKWAIQYNKKEGKKIFDFDEVGGEISMTVLHLAAYDENREIMKILIDNNCDYMIYDNLQRLPKNICIRDNYLLKLLRIKEKKDLFHSFFLKKKLNNARLKNKHLSINIEENDINEICEQNTINLPSNSNKPNFFNCKSKYFEPNLNLKILRDYEENYEVDTDELLNVKNRTVRVILKSPNNIEKIEQYQALRMSFSKNSFSTEKLKTLCHKEKMCSLKTFSLQNLETIIRSINSNNLKIKEQLLHKDEDSKAIHFEFLHNLMILQKKQILFLKNYEEELDLLDSFIKQDKKTWNEKQKDINKVGSLLNKKNLYHSACNNFVLKVISLNLQNKEIENIRICLCILQNIPFIKIENFKEILNIFKKSFPHFHNINKLVIYEILNLLILLKN